LKSKVKILIWAGTAILMICLLLYMPGCKKDMDKARKHYELGVEYHKQDQADQAIKELQEAIKIDPNYAKAHYELGVLYNEKEDQKNAVSELLQAIKIDPDYAEAHFLLGGIYQLLRGYDQALKEYEEVLRIDPGFPRIHTAIGNLYYERGIRTWAKAIKLNWSYLLPDTLKEISYKDKDELNKAIENYINAIQSDTTNVEAYSKLYQAYYTLAQDEYQKAIEINPADTGAQLQLGLTLLERGYPNKAAVQCEALRNLDPKAAGMLSEEINHREQEALDLKKRGIRK
jgi:tetratricopeptide (TPR) repeat protein